jgi:hypothetical protein
MSDAKKAAAAAEPHHIKARVFALEFMLGQRVVLVDIPHEAQKLERYLLGAKANATPEEVDARITAIKVAARGMIARSALIDAARPFEKYVLTGQAPAKAKAPAAAGEAPADDPTKRDSTVPPEGGEASEIRPHGRPSSRPELGRQVEV